MLMYFTIICVFAQIWIFSSHIALYKQLKPGADPGFENGGGAGGSGVSF